MYESYFERSLDGTRRVLQKHSRKGRRPKFRAELADTLPEYDLPPETIIPFITDNNPRLRLTACRITYYKYTYEYAGQITTLNPDNFPLKSHHDFTSWVVVSVIREDTKYHAYDKIFPIIARIDHDGNRIIFDHGDGSTSRGTYRGDPFDDDDKKHEALVELILEQKSKPEDT